MDNQTTTTTMTSLDRHTLRQYKYQNLTYDNGDGDLGQFVPITISPPEQNHGTMPIRSIPQVPMSSSVLTSIDERFSTLGPVIEAEGYDSDASMPLSYTYVGQLLRPAGKGYYSAITPSKVGDSPYAFSREADKTPGAGSQRSASTRAPSEYSGDSGASPMCYDEVDLHADPLMITRKQQASNLPTKSKFTYANKAASIAMTNKKLEESRTRFEEKKWKKKSDVNKGTASYLQLLGMMRNVKRNTT